MIDINLLSDRPSRQRCFGGRAQPPQGADSSFDKLAVEDVLGATAGNTGQIVALKGALKGLDCFGHVLSHDFEEVDQIHVRPCLEYVSH